VEEKHIQVRENFGCHREALKRDKCIFVTTNWITFSFPILWFSNIVFLVSLDEGVDFGFASIFPQQFLRIVFPSS